MTVSSVGIPLPIVTLNRECGACTKCCEGWLSAEIHGIRMYPGKPCHLVEINKGCKDYDNRPEDPCKKFFCEWLTTPSMPEHFKPEISGVIISQQAIDGIKFIKVTEAPNPLTIEILSWVVINCHISGLNLCWESDNQLYWLGSTEFSEKMNKAFSKSTSPNK